MRIVTFQTPEEKAQGLQHLRQVDDRTLYLFPNTFEGAVFHSRNVPEPFDIAFVGPDGTVLHVVNMTPPGDLAKAPEGTVMAVETKGGRCAIWGLLPGSTLAL